MPESDPVIVLGLSKRLVDMMVEEKILKAPDLAQALDQQRKTGENLGAILIKSGFVGHEQLLDFVARHCGLVRVRLAEVVEIPQDVLGLVSENMARQHLLIPVSKNDSEVTVAMADPMNVTILDDLKMVTGLSVKAALAPHGEIVAAIDKHYKSRIGAQQAMDDILRSDGEGGGSEVAAIPLDGAEGETNIASLEQSAEEAPVVKLVNLILAGAVTSRASDIHIEPYAKESRIRYRIDGVLTERPAPPRRYHNALVARIKIMANLNIAERRVPQDGRLKIKVGGKAVDMRVSVLPCTFGEKIVLRLLDSSGLMVEMAQLGFEPEALAVFNKCMKMPYGINLITGPTGSGKSTTLYSALANLNAPGVNIVTIEDPVEYQIHGINQVQVNSQVGLTFAEGLRSFLRQDPNIIMLGEIRDLETAQIAVNAALTGHLVFSTLHTNDAAGSITRLGMMGVEPFLVSSALLMVVAQRLVRAICPKCREAYSVDPEWLLKLGIPKEALSPSGGKISLYRGKGCDHCAKTGYKGRQGLYEVLEVTDPLRGLILNRASATEIKAFGRKNGMLSLRECAVRKLLAGHTTAEEVIRVTAAEPGT